MFKRFLTNNPPLFEM